MKRKAYIKRKTPLPRQRTPIKKSPSDLGKGSDGGMTPRSPIKRSRMKRGPSKKWRTRPDVDIKDEGREVCNKWTEGGKLEYKARLAQLFHRQYDPSVRFHRCCNCLQRMDWTEACFEHEDGRFAARIDERIEVDGKPKNGASHLWCNAERGSRRTRIWHGPPEELHGPEI